MTLFQLISTTHQKHSFGLWDTTNCCSCSERALTAKWRHKSAAITKVRLSLPISSTHEVEQRLGRGKKPASTAEPHPF